MTPDPSTFAVSLPAPAAAPGARARPDVRRLGFLVARLLPDPKTGGIG